MNVLIFPTSDRLGLASAIAHYNKLGHKVHVPKHGTLGLDWSTGAQWPALLCLDPDSGKRNLELHGLRKEGAFFGEDAFIEVQNIPTSKDVPLVRICSEEEIADTEINIYHTLRGGENHLLHYKSLMEKKKAVWVSSTVNAWEDKPGGLSPRNVAKILPARYESTKYENSFNMWCLDIEYDLFSLSKEEQNRQKCFASFNHNFHVRQPDDYDLFCKMNEILSKKGIQKVTNYGGNIRAMGADIRYSNGGPVGNYETLSPIETIKKYKTLTGVVHFKQTDWGGGVFFHSLFSHTPVVTTRRYVEKSNSGKYLVDGVNSIHISSPEEAANSIERLLDEKEFSKLSAGMKDMKNSLINEAYWEGWRSFLEKVS